MLNDPFIEAYKTNSNLFYFKLFNFNLVKLRSNIPQCCMFSKANTAMFFNIQPNYNVIEMHAEEAQHKVVDYIKIYAVNALHQSS